jgi:aminoglycoside 2''-phosphotransferase
MAYPRLPGQPLTLSLLAGLSPTVRRGLAEQLGGFLRLLHTRPLTPTLPHTSAPVTPQAWNEIRSGVEQKVYPLLLPHQREWAAAFFDEMLTDPAAFKYPPALCHGDLAPYHILYDPAVQRISAVLDFGVAGIGDPAMDIGNLLQAYGESFVGMFAGVYPEMPELMRRGRFYARAIELEWALNGLESGETFWFTAHLGNARDF